MKILVADDEKIIRLSLQRQLENDHQIILASSFKEAKEALESVVVDLAFIDLHLDESDELTGTKLIEEIRKDSPETILIAMTGLEDPDLIEKCYRLGASDYIFKPIVSKTVSLIIRRATTLHKLIRQNRALRTQAGNRRVEKLTLTTKSPRFQATLDRARKLAGSPESVLIRGETGVGKELMASFLWSLEGDDSRPFIPVNCGAITESLAESTLFGHRKGAFSGATENRIGLFEAADGGDLFLDEIATLPLDIQVKLLRVLNNGEITPVGQNVPKKINCRIIAATNESLEEYVQQKTFREDILYRIQQVTITVPPLRERREDIPDLISKFLSDRGFSEKRLSNEAIQFCLKYHWPGNIRELKQTIQLAALFADGNEVSRQDIESQLRSDPSPAELSKTDDIKFDEVMNEALVQGNFNRLSREYEQRLVRYALSKVRSETAAAKFLGIPKSTLQSKRKVWGWN